MIVSKTKLFTIGVLFSISAAIASPNNVCSCSLSQSEINANSCETDVINKEKSPTWWDWFTSNRSTQFHFFQLMELLHSNDDSITSAQVKTSSETGQQV